MDDETLPITNANDNNFWSTLSTVTRFDRGNEARTTLLLNNNNGTQNNHQLVGLVTPTNSLLIESLIKQLCTMFEGDTQRRNKLFFTICDKLHELKLIDSSYNMKEFESMRGQYQRELYHLVAVARAATGSEGVLQAPSCLMVEWSRYKREFQEISFIASGGFGSVFKALHRLDGIEYAIKKIVVRSGRVKSIMQHLEEVKTIAKLNHTNIVSYKGAWVETRLLYGGVPSLLPVKHSLSNKSSESNRTRKSRSHAVSIPPLNVDASSKLSVEISQETSLSHNKNSKRYVSSNKATNEFKESGRPGDCLVSHDIVNKRFHELNTTTNIIGQRIVNKSHSEEYVDEMNSNSVSFRNDSEDTNGSESCEESNRNGKLYSYVTPVQYSTLYIQMALCEKTLQQWLEERRDGFATTVIAAILTQILCGLNYIHSTGIVHHDIKPSNIFVSTSGRLQVQLGDFGLACPLQREDHHSVVGTHMYAAPEQLQGKCDPKSDLYSAGIVLLELLSFTKTQMELIKIIQSLKAGRVPVELGAASPEWAHVASRLVQNDPRKRPSANELLQELNEDKDVIISQLRNSIAEKDNVIQRLEGRISLLEEQISKFTLLLENTKS